VFGNDPDPAGNDPDRVNNDPNAEVPDESDERELDIPAEDDLSGVFPPSSSDISDNMAIYDADGYAQTDVIRIDLITRTRSGTCVEDDQSGCTLADVLSDIDSRDSFKVDIPVHFRATDYADDGLFSNAELRQRGGGARFAEQKSFRLKIEDKDQLWRGERHLQLNKHPFDNSRIRNKLSFDLMSDIDNLPSFRTQFVHLWIDDGQGPVDQGLYTHAERGDRRYLERHGLDTDARLYKANFFRFRPSDLSTLLIDDEGEPINEKLFESVLEVQAGDDHKNLVNMLRDLNDPDVSFDSVMSQYFNENNVLTWIAVNLLLGQQDITRHNFFLYNPEDSKKFYFIPWDYDLAFLKHEFPPSELTNEALKLRLDYGYAVVRENIFLRNYYRRPGAHQKILEAVEELRDTHLNDATIRDRITVLSEASAPIASAQPDIQFNQTRGFGSFELAEAVTFNHDALMNSFGIPLPPTLEEPVLEDEVWRFDWSSAHDVTGGDLTYELQVSTGHEFLADQIVFRASGIEATGDAIRYSVEKERFNSGTHYVRLFARSVNEPDKYWQVSDNDEVIIDGDIQYGLISFDVN